MSEETISWVLRPARPADLPEVVSLLEAAGLPTGDVDERMLEVFLVAVSSEGIVGSGGVEILGPYGLLRSVAVSEELRGNGLGIDLVRQCLRLAQAQSHEHLYLLTETAENFFPRFGFRAVDRSAAPSEIQSSHEYSVACDTTAVLMVCELAKSNIT